MKGVILAGGKGTRLAPLTNLINKHLLPVGRYPMIHHGVIKLRDAGIQDILIVTGKQSAGLYAQYLGGGEELGVKITLRIQDEAGGIAQALGLADDFIPLGGKFIVLLGDNLFEDSLLPHWQAFVAQQAGARVLVKKVPDPERYGVPVFAGKQIVRIDEKPVNPESNYCVTGIYMYDRSVFDVIAATAPSKRGELEITDVNNHYAQLNKLEYAELEGWWSDAGTFDSLLTASYKMMGIKEPSGESHD
ncbi:MAG: NTP transferase domain-containing protein [Gorillibacterium sp.]|nr:NTP transferase domain-containing protein [Gorillibacterium sp.]